MEIAVSERVRVSLESFDVAYIFAQTQIQAAEAGRSNVFGNLAQQFECDTISFVAWEPRAFREFATLCLRAYADVLANRQSNSVLIPWQMLLRVIFSDARMSLERG